MADPPLLAGGVKATVACPLPAVADVTDGAPGGPRGTSDPEDADGGEVPAPLVAVTVKV